MGQSHISLALVGVFSLGLGYLLGSWWERSKAKDSEKLPVVEESDEDESSDESDEDEEENYKLVSCSLPRIVPSPLITLIFKT